MQPLGPPPTYDTELAYPPLILLLPPALLLGITLPALAIISLATLSACWGVPGVMCFPSAEVKPI